MPDFSMLIQIADYFGVGIEKILDEERKVESTESKAEEVFLKITDYNSGENMKFYKKLNRLFLLAIATFVVFMIIDIQGLGDIELYESIESYMLGLVLGALVVGTLYTSRYMSKIKDFKMRILRRMVK